MSSSDNPVIALNRAVAVAMHRGPHEGLGLLERLARDQRIAEDHRLHAARAHLLEMTGQYRSARDSYRDAAQRATNLQQQRYLHTKAARVAGD